MKERGLRKTLIGEVVSDKMDKTRIIRVTRTIKHAFYNKVMKKSRKFAVDDRKNESHTGDTVEIVETRPLSKTKRWRLLRIVQAVKQ